MRSYGLREALNPNTAIPIRKVTQPQSPTERRPREGRGRHWCCATTGQGTPGPPGSPEVRRGKEGVIRGCTALMIPWFGTSGLENSKRINFCCFRSPGLSWFVTAALGNKYTTAKFSVNYLKLLQFIISHDSMNWQFGLGSEGQFCWSCCGCSCGCIYLGASLKLGHVRWAHSQGQGRGAGWPYAWSLIFSSLVQCPLHGGGKPFRSKRMKLEAAGLL